MELKLTVDGLEKERDFYFSKLRDIELICQEHESENNPILSRIIDILYATEVQYIRTAYNKSRLQCTITICILFCQREFTVEVEFKFLNHTDTYDKILQKKLDYSFWLTICLGNFSKASKTVVG